MTIIMKKYVKELVSTYFEGVHDLWGISRTMQSAQEVNCGIKKAQEKFSLEL